MSLDNLIEVESIEGKDKVMRSLIQFGAATQEQLVALTERNLLQ